MWRLHRYYLKELAVNASITFVVMFGVVLISLVYRGIQRSQGGELIDAALITLFFALDALPHLLTIAFLIATVVTFTRAAQDRELVAIRAAGISPRVPMLAAVLVGIFMSVGASFANHYLIPEVHYRKYRVIKDIVRSAFLNLGLNTDRVKFGGYVLTYRERDADAGAFLDCTIYAPKPLPGMESPIIFVDRVVIPKIDDKYDETSDIPVTMSGVRDPVSNVRSSDLRFTVPLDQIGASGGRAEKDDDVPSDQLLAEVMRGVHSDPTRAKYTLFRRSCFALMPFLMAPIGFCIAEMARFRGRVVALVMLLVPLGAFYLGEVLGARLLLSTDNAWCGWMPALLLSVIGVPLVWRQLRK